MNPVKPSTWSDEVRTGLIVFAQNLLNVLVLMDLVHLRDEQFAGIMLLVSNFTTLFFLIMKKAPQGAPASGFVADWIAEMRRTNPGICWWRDGDSVCTLERGHGGGIHD